MPKKRISSFKADLIVKDLKEALGDRLMNLACVDLIIKETLGKHFEIVEIDINEIECSSIDDGFAV